MIGDNKLYRWGGIAFALGNVLFIVNKLDEMSRHFLARPMPDLISGRDTLLILTGQAALIIGYVALYQFHSERVRGSGKFALRVLCGGGVLLALGHVTFMSALADYLPSAILPYAEYLFLLVVVGLLALLAGLIWFGVLNLRQPVLHQWRWLPLATGLMGFIGFFVFRSTDITPIFLVFRTLFALGLIGLGLSLWGERTVQMEPAR
jgi:hypothetical protein